MEGTRMSNIHYVQKDNYYHAWLAGRLDITTISDVKNTISELLNNRPGAIAFNFNDVDFVDSSAMAAFVNLLKTSVAKKTEFIFYGLKPDIQNIFKVACLDRFFNIIPEEKFKKEYAKLML